MISEMELIEAKAEMLNSEILEYKIYIEISAITLLFVMVIFLTSKGMIYVQQRSMIGYSVILGTIMLSLAIIYMIFQTIRTAHMITKIKSEQKLIKANWLEK